MISDTFAIYFVVLIFESLVWNRIANLFIFCFILCYVCYVVLCCVVLYCVILFYFIYYYYYYSTMILNLCRV